jgi:HAE1 family hydrophobic/amphiphilic exporter-1
MNITEISVRRPAAITMVIAFLIGLGVFGYRNLGADLMPSMDIPVITIRTTYTGANADEIKKDIVKPIEDAVSGISGVDTMSSTAKEGSGQTVIQFTTETNMNSAFLDVEKAVDKVQSKLPTDADKPVLSKVDLNAASVLTLSINGNVPYDELYNEADKVQQDMEKVPGIGNVSLQGSNPRQLSIKLDKTAVEYYGVNVNSLLTKIKSDNTNIPAGQIKQEKMNETLRVIGEFNSIDDVKNITVPTANGAIVRLADIAEIELDYPDATQLRRINSKSTIGIDLQKQSDANVVDAVNNAKQAIAKIQKQLPKGINLVIADDTTTTITSSLTEIKHNLVEGIFTTAIVLLLFLRSWRSSLVVLVAIPTSLISTFFMMYELHFTLNMMSLMGLSLCIGILVDDSIVVLENIQRHLAMGKDPKVAAIEGRNEIGMAAVAITLCDVVIFIPIAFVSGMVGKYFREFGLTIAVASLFSLFISFTITPMLASRLFKKKVQPRNVSLQTKFKDNPISKMFSKFSSLLNKVTKAYSKFLIWSLDNRAKVLIGASILVVLSISLLKMGVISTELMPQTDQSRFTVNLSLTPGSTLNQTDEKVKAVESFLHKVPGIDSYSSTVGGNSDTASGNIVVRLKPKNQRTKTQTQIASQVRAFGTKMTGVKFSVAESSSIAGMRGMGGGGGSNRISIDVAGDDSDTLKTIADKVESILKSVPGIIEVSNSTATTQSEIQVKINRLAASQYGVSTSDIAAVIRTGIQGSTTGTYTQNDIDYSINVQFMDGQIKSAADISAIKVLNSSGQLIPLGEIASVTQNDSPVEETRDDREDVVTLSANIQGRTLGDISNDINAKLKPLALPDGYSIKFGGEQKQMSQAFGPLIQVLIASFVLVYMILVILYESFLTPFIRMISLPCAIIGAFGMLALTGKTLNMMSMIGLIMLDGLASKNGTLLIDYTNTLMSKGMNLREALIEAGTTRLRPIIMTTMTMIVGMLPSALALGDGSEMKSGMSLVVIGGMITSTILSPIVLPVVYTLMDDLKHFISKKYRQITHVEEA